MAGLLDGNYTPDPLSMGLLALGSSLMTPRAMGGGIGPGMNAFAQQAMAAQQMRRQMEQDAERTRMLRERADMDRERFGLDKDLLGLKRGELDWKRQQDDASRTARGEFEAAYSQAGGKWSPQLSMMALRAGIKGEDLERLAKGGNLGREKLTWQNGVGLEPFTGAPQAVVPDANAPFNFQLTNGALQSVPNAPVQDFQMSRARAGATSIGMPRVEVKMGDSIAGQIGEIVMQSRNKAITALKQVDNTDQMMAALQSGNVFIGPGATVKTAIGRLATALGAAGANTQEKLQNTRQIVQGLARIGVAARDQLRGQGTVTDSEAAALQKAESGDIDNLTEGELRDLVSVARKAAALDLQMHQQNIEAMRASPSTAPQVRFFDLPNMGPALQRLQVARPPSPAVAPSGATPNAPPPPRVGMVVDGFRYKGGDPSQRSSWEPAQ